MFRPFLIVYRMNRKTTRSGRFSMAEREGFEPSIPVKVYRISSPARSTTLPPLQRGPILATICLVVKPPRRQKHQHPKRNREIILEIWDIHQAMNHDRDERRENERILPARAKPSNENPSEGDETKQTRLAPEIQNDVVWILEDLDKVMAMIGRDHCRIPAKPRAR